MHCDYLDRDGKSHPMIMGCYGIGVGRAMAAVIEQSCDEYGPIWPMSIAPYQVELCAILSLIHIWSKITLRPPSRKTPPTPFFLLPGLPLPGTLSLLTVRAPPVHDEAPSAPFQNLRVR